MDSQVIPLPTSRNYGEKRETDLSQCPHLSLFKIWIVHHVSEEINNISYGFPIGTYGSES